MTTELNENNPNPAVLGLTTPADPLSSVTESSPGTMIRDARQAQHLSVDDLAAHTKLARATVEALERDDFGALLEPVYVRGYYRKCAKVLGVDEKTLIDAYASRVAQRTPLPPTKLRLASGTELGSSSRLPLAMAILFVVVAVVICAFLWWLRGATSKLQTEQDLPSSISVLPTPSAPNAQTPLASDAVATPSDDAAVQGNAMPPVPPAESPATVSTPAPVVENAVTMPASDAGAAPGTAPGTAPTVVGNGPLQIVFNGASWVRINDASGKVLLDGLIAAGERRALGGVPPFSLFIGKAPAVSVSFDGKAVDLAPYTRDNATARLTLPATP